MAIYHYTTIKSLALILISQKIRFKRLDLLDDLKEIDGLPDELKSLFYVSCWTEDNEENLSLWSLYTRVKGIRIEFPNHFYQNNYIKRGDYGNWGYDIDIVSPLPIEKLRTDKYFIGNSFWLDDGFYIKIEYSDKYTELKSQYIINDKEEIQVNNLSNLIRFKNSIWKFQNEYRFYLMAIPLPPLEQFNGDTIKQINNHRIGQLSNTHDFIDVDIDAAVLNNIIVRLHPNCDYADKVIVESLLSKYTENGKIQNSHLDDTYRNT